MRITIAGIVWSTILLFGAAFSVDGETSSTATRQDQRSAPSNTLSSTNTTEVPQHQHKNTYPLDPDTSRIPRDLVRPHMQGSVHPRHHINPQKVLMKNKVQQEYESGRNHIQYAIRAGRVQSRGVNLGSWLVAESWMIRQSDIWRDLDDEIVRAGEQAAFKNTPREVALGRFKWHRDNFITEEEIRKIAEAGLNTVRVPVGYWIVGFDKFDWTNHYQWQNFAPGGLEYLDRLICDWAKKYNIAVMISMHGAKGSQNGADHSAPEQIDKSYWSSYPENVASTLDSVKFLANRYKNDEAFLGIGLLNEPSGSTQRDVLYKYYADAYSAIRYNDHNDCILTIAPLLWEQSPWFLTDILPGATNVWVEWHRYFVWGYEHSSEDDLLNGAMDRFRWDVEIWKQRSTKQMFIGEFSFATSGKFQNVEGLKEFGRRQLKVLTDNVNGGWTFWSWRIYGDEWGVNPWSLRSLLREGIFPALT